MKKKHIPQLLAGLLAGAVLGWAGVQFGRMLHFTVPMSSPAEKISGVAIMLFAMWFALAFHELAHLVAGLWQGFRFHLYVAGFLGLRRHPQTERIQVYFNTDTRLFGGVAATLPRATSPDLPRRFARMVIAGPLGSLLLTVVGGLGGWFLAASPATGSRFFTLFLLVSPAVSALLFLATTLPSRTGMFFTDRARYFRLISGGRTADIERAMLELIAFAQSGQPLAEMDLGNLELGRQDPNYAAYTEYYAFFYHLAVGQPEKASDAAARMTRLPDEMPALFRAELWKEVCFAAAFLKQDAAEANAWWKKIEKQLSKRQDVSVLRVKAALCRVNGETAEAQHLARRGLALLKKKPALNGSELVEQQLLRDLLRL